MIVNLCDWCGVVTLDTTPCRCVPPADTGSVLRRHRDAVARAQHTDGVRRAREQQPIMSTADAEPAVRATR